MYRHLSTTPGLSQSSARPKNSRMCPETSATSPPTSTSSRRSGSPSGQATPRWEHIWGFFEVGGTSTWIESFFPQLLLFKCCHLVSGILTYCTCISNFHLSGDASSFAMLLLLLSLLLFLLLMLLLLLLLLLLFVVVVATSVVAVVVATVAAVVIAFCRWYCCCCCYCFLYCCCCCCCPCLLSPP